MGFSFYVILCIKCWDIRLSNDAAEVQNSISYKLFYEEGNEASKSEIVYGYKVNGHDYLVFNKKEIDSAKPLSTKLIELDKFVNFFQADREDMAPDPEQLR